MASELTSLMGYFINTLIEVLEEKVEFIMDENSAILCGGSMSVKDFVAEKSKMSIAQVFSRTVRRDQIKLKIINHCVPQGLTTTTARGSQSISEKLVKCCRKKNYISILVNS